MAARLVEKHLFPLWVKIPCTLFVAVMVPVYARFRDPAEFLWFSDIALFTGVAALWLGSPLLAGMMAVGSLLPELVWNASFFLRLLTGLNFLDLTAYMFNPEFPLALRALSLFHVFLPPLSLWMLHRLGYDPRALKAQTALCWLVLPLTRLLTDPAANVNWTDRFPNGTQAISPALHIGILMALYPLLVCLPAHLALRRLFPRPRGRLDTRGGLDPV